MPFGCASRSETVKGWKGASCECYPIIRAACDTSRLDGRQSADCQLPDRPIGLPLCTFGRERDDRLTGEKWRDTYPQTCRPYCWWTRLTTTARCMRNICASTDFIPLK